MTVPAYTNIAHFRAPYKNSYVYTGVGNDDFPVAPPPSNGAAAEKELMEKHLSVGKDGSLSWNADTAHALREALKGYDTTFTSTAGMGVAVEVKPFTTEEFNAAANDPSAAAMLRARSGATWVDQQAAEGKVVFASVGLLVPGAGPKTLAALDPADRERISFASRIMPILALPGAVTPPAPTPGKVTPTSKASIFASPTALAVGVVLVGGMGVVVYRGFQSKKRLAPIKV